MKIKTPAKRLDLAYRYHGRFSDIPLEVVSTLIALNSSFSVLAGEEIVTIGPSDIQIEFPLPANLRGAFKDQRDHVRPPGHRDTYIYGLRGLDGRCFYIGSTVQTLNQRLNDHVSEARTGRHPNRRLAKHLVELGDDVEIFSIDVVPESRRFEHEYEVIRSYLDSGAPLLNNQLATQVWSRSYVLGVKGGRKDG